MLSRLCYTVQQAMLPSSTGYATLFSRLCYPVQQAMLSKVENKAKLSPAKLGLGLSLAIITHVITYIASETH